VKTHCSSLTYSKAGYRISQDTIATRLECDKIFTDHLIAICTCDNKKFELMLTRRAKAYNSSCSQTVSLSLAISLQFILGVCAAAKDRKNQ